MNVVRPVAIALTIVALIAVLAVSCARSGARAPTPAPKAPPVTTAPADDPVPPPIPSPDGAPRSGTERVPIPPPPGAAGTAPAPAVPPAPPATTPRRDAPHVRVVLSSVAKAGRAAVAVAGGWTLRSLDGAEISRGRGLRADLVIAGDVRVGPTTLPADGAELVPDKAGDLQVGTRTYPGALRIARTADGRMRPQIDLDVETYLEGVVAGELPPEFPREARRAQAVIARTYLLSQPGVTRASASIQVDDTGLTDQEFVGIAGATKTRDAVRDAVRSTRGLVLLDGGTTLRAWYHSICGGHTCASAPVFKVPQAAPLAGVECTTCVGTKYYRWQSRLAGAKVVKAAGLTGALQGFRILEATPEGRATWFEVQAGGKRKRAHAAEFRLAVGPSDLRSTWIDWAETTGGDLVVAGRGWGHGVGLCQWGAKGLADRGATGESILAHYYPGATLERAW